LARHSCAEPGSGRVLNKTIEDRLQIALKLTAFCILSTVIAKNLLCVAHLSMKNNDQGLEGSYVKQPDKDHERACRIPSIVEFYIC